MNSPVGLTNIGARIAAFGAIHFGLQVPSALCVLFFCGVLDLVSCFGQWPPKDHSDLLYYQFRRIFVDLSRVPEDLRSLANVSSPNMRARDFQPDG